MLTTVLAYVHWLKTCPCLLKYLLLFNIFSSSILVHAFSISLAKMVRRFCDIKKLGIVSLKWLSFSNRFILLSIKSNNELLNHSPYIFKLIFLHFQMLSAHLKFFQSQLLFVFHFPYIQCPVNMLLFSILFLHFQITKRFVNIIIIQNWIQWVNILIHVIWCNWNITLDLLMAIIIKYILLNNWTSIRFPYNIIRMLGHLILLFKNILGLLWCIQCFQTALNGLTDHLIILFYFSYFESSLFLNVLLIVIFWICVNA